MKEVVGTTTVRIGGTRSLMWNESTHLPLTHQRQRLGKCIYQIRLPKLLDVVPGYKSSYSGLDFAQKKPVNFQSFVE